MFLRTQEKDVEKNDISKAALNIIALGQTNVKKVRLQIKEDLGQKVTGLKLGASKDFSQRKFRYNLPVL